MLNILFKGFTDFSGISFIIRVKESWFYSYYTLKDVWVVFNYSNTMKEVKILAHECNDLLNPYSSLLLISAVKNKFVGFLLLLKKKNTQHWTEECLNFSTWLGLEDEEQV